MANKLISQILDTVKEADNIVAKANYEKREIINKAREESKDEAYEIIYHAKVDSKEYIDQKTKEANDLSDKKVEEIWSKLSDYNISSLDENDVNRAVDYIVEKVIEDGNS